MLLPVKDEVAHRFEIVQAPVYFIKAIIVVVYLIRSLVKASLILDGLLSFNMLWIADVVKIRAVLFEMPLVANTALHISNDHKIFKKYFFSHHKELLIEFLIQMN